MAKQNHFNSNRTSQIIGVQFSILSPSEIRKGSVAEIVSRDTYINNKPVIGGLFDPRMGVLEPGLICPTDGYDYMKTPGYFGHIELARPVFYIQYLNTVIKILRCVCFKCSKLLISKEKYEKILKEHSYEARWNMVFQLASKVKRCGDDTEDGCGCKQPHKIKKEGLASLFAEWDNLPNDSTNAKDKLNIKLFPETIIKMFRRISDDDIAFMGFSPIFSRPDWMICQVLAVPPPSVRPSVKHDAQQRSEDDISHILVNIIKANNTLKEKINVNAPSNIIDDWTTLLQYYIATMVDNKIPGVASVAQRSGRPLKSIKERINGKTGRVRGNLMGKRVDYSARSVITPDPNLSIEELGVPLKIAKNLTKPEAVNDLNKSFLMKLIKNGPDKHPGAKILQKKNGENISLRYVDRDSLSLENGDIVHRHIMNGDGVLFNRQPTLHRMSMMCHSARIMPKADTFRLNVAVTKPYNADFDGDEMNLHAPQSIHAEIELKTLANVSYQLISPANNQSIIGIFQDSLLGIYRFTRKIGKHNTFSQRDLMNLLMPIRNIDISKLKSSTTAFDILSQILPPLSLKYKTKQFGDDEDFETSNNVLEIVNGKHVRGQIQKSVLGGGGKGLIQRICNDFGNIQSKEFIDNIQNIVNEYMKQSGYSVGISDLIADNKTNQTIIDKIISKKKEVQTLIDETRLGVFTNNTGKTNEEQFETEVNEILNAATEDAGRIGRKSLSQDNRFVIMVNAGSKGSDLNISQMISCLGQQNVDGKRIPYGFEDRTLPHYSKFDDSPNARGFVENSFISGLTPQELFFHAMGGRTGLIDTAVKTSQTGYIQRRLIKGLEDLMVHYDMTVRNNKGKIVQYLYGDDGFDPIKIENQKLHLVDMKIEEIYAHFEMPSDNLKDKIFTTSYTKPTLKRIKKQENDMKKRCKSLIDECIYLQKEIIENVYQNKSNNDVQLPVSFSYIINNTKNQHNIQSNSMVDITPYEALQLLDNTMKNLEKITYCKPNPLFRVMYYFSLTPKELLMIKRFNRKAFILLLSQIEYYYKKSIVAPGEMVGMIAAQSIGEPTTQMTLNTFHFAGVASKSTATRGVPRVEEILSLSSSIQKPSITIYLKEDDQLSRERALAIANNIENTRLIDVVKNVQICFDPNEDETLINDDAMSLSLYNKFEKMVDECSGVIAAQKQKSKWILRFIIDKEILLEKNITMDDIHFAIKNSYKDEISCVFSDYNSDELILRVRINKVIPNKKNNGSISPLDQGDQIYYLKNFQQQVMDNIILRGVKHIKKVLLRKNQGVLLYNEGKYTKKDTWVLDTIGSNLVDVLGLGYIDKTKTYSNNIPEIYETFGIEAARQSIYTEFQEVLEDSGTYINEHHLNMLCDRMTNNYKMTSIFRHGINNDNIGPMAKASFEETPEMFIKAAKHAELDIMRGISANIMCGQQGYYGTNICDLYLDIESYKKLEAQSTEIEEESEEIKQLFQNIDNPDDPCSKSNLTIKNNIANIGTIDTGNDDFTVNF
tara:strand:- start:59 stop:4576 length:4518 start_codon:yes stop_codon:yes gene_type:complete